MSNRPCPAPHRYVALVEILDPDMPLGQLHAEACTWLALEAQQLHVELANPKFTVTEAADGMCLHIEADALGADNTPSPPSPDVDWVRVDRFISGDVTVRLNRAEKADAYRQLTASGVSGNKAQRRLRLSGSTVRAFRATWEQKAIGA